MIGAVDDRREPDRGENRPTAALELGKRSTSAAAPEFVNFASEGLPVAIVKVRPMPGATASSRRVTGASRINLPVADGAALPGEGRASGSIRRIRGSMPTAVE